MPAVARRPADRGRRTPARAPQLSRLDFENTFRNPADAAVNRWSALVTPFSGGTATPDPAAVYELRSIVALPEQLTLATRFDQKAKSFLLTGMLSALGRPEAGVQVDFYGAASLYAPFKKLASTKTDQRGRYSLRQRFSTSMWIEAFVGVYIGACDSRVASPAPGGCVLQSWSPVFGQLAHATLPKGVKPPAAPKPPAKTRR